MAAPTPELSPDELSELLTAYMPEIPGYRVLRRLGRGGMSFVYLGVQESLDRQVAIKVILPTEIKDEISKLRFEREARIIAKLQHPSIVGIHDVGRTDLGLLYYVMPYLPRGHLGQRDLRSDEGRLLGILRAVLSALDYAHARGVVHRDIKSENVLFDSLDRPLLTDFGIAIRRSDFNRVTAGGYVLGSVTHMAPEQARGEKVDGRADLYSLGVLAYEKLVGRLPFEAEGALSLAVRHAVDPVPRLPADMAHWQVFIDRALAKQPEARFAHAREMLVALDAIEHALGLDSSTEPSPPRRAAARAAEPEDSGGEPENVPANAAAQRRRTPPGLPAWSGRPRFIAAASVVVLVLAVVVAWQAWSPPSARAPLPPEAERPQLAAAAPAVLAPVVAPEPALAEPALTAIDPPLAEAETPEAEVLPPGEQALRDAAAQIQRRRLTLPPGDNALESLQRAHAHLPNSPRLARLGESWLAAVQPFVAEAFASAETLPELRLYEAARELSEQLGLGEGPGWQSIQAAPVGWLRGRLQQALAANDLDALRAARAQAEPLGIAPALLEPEWSQTLVLARLGERLQADGTVLLRLPEGRRAGLAGMAGPVTRADYARFAADTGRDAANCRVRGAVLNLRKRRWDSPGFEQGSLQPVVCVSLADAQAYADWLSAREGRRYRLPSADEWAALPGTADAATRCQSQPAACGSRAQVREWPAACTDGCARQPLLGFGWRDAEGAAAAREPGVESRDGHDDVGFRLVREVARAELEVR